MAEMASVQARETAKGCVRARDMLAAMGQASKSVERFAGILATVVEPAPGGGPGFEPGWPEDGLLDDVAVFSLESALRSRADRVQPEPLPPADRVARLAGDLDKKKPPQPEHDADWKLRSAAREAEGRSATPDAPGLASSGTVAPIGLHRARELKRASITIRLSEPECARLKARAAESGLTISEYLRSCTLEVESLRAQVKEALATMRALAAAKGPPAVAVRPSLFGRMAQIWPKGRGETRAASA